MRVEEDAVNVNLWSFLTEMPLIATVCLNLILVLGMDIGWNSGNDKSGDRNAWVTAANKCDGSRELRFLITFRGI